MFFQEIFKTLDVSCNFAAASTSSTMTWWKQLNFKDNHIGDNNWDDTQLILNHTKYL